MVAAHSPHAGGPGTRGSGTGGPGTGGSGSVGRCSGGAHASLPNLIAAARRLALVGLAKNTGKTETLRAILTDHAVAGRRVGVTSVGRDGEERDALDARIAKPRIRLAAGDFVATTAALLRASAIPHERLLDTGMRTPLGEVVIARLHGQGTVEVAGPNVAADIRAVSDSMAAFGAEQVVIDGAIDRRAASSPAVADGLVVATGAVLSENIERVVALTREAVELVRLPLASGGSADEGEEVTLARGLVLGSEPAEIAALLREHPRASAFRVEGALSERFLESLLQARRERSGRELRITVGDPTKVFLSCRGPGWYRRQGLVIEVLRATELKAITVNPVAPQSHRFDSSRLRAAIEESIEDIPVFDVLAPDDRGAAAPTSPEFPPSARSRSTDR
jgi:hypothetical protein